jgi:S1-C subfamily serine protease
MAWTELDFDPPLPQGLGGGKSGTPELNAVGGLVKFAGALLGKRPAPQTVARGFLGLQLADGDAKPAVKAVLVDGPAAKAGVKAGDVITHVEGEAVKHAADVLRLTGKVTAGKSVKLTVERGGKATDITVTAGEGL